MADLPALVVGANTPIGLALARGLRPLGVPLVGAAQTPFESGCRSALWLGVLPVGGPSDQAWLAALGAAHRRYGRMVLFPAFDGAVRVVAEHRAELAERFDFVLPELAVVERLLDKTAFHRWAMEHGFPVPRTMVLDDPAGVPGALRELTFPVVLKPFERTLGWQELSRQTKVYRLATRDDWARLPFDPFRAVDRVVLQEWIPGRDSDVYFCLTYRDRGGTGLAARVGRKLLQWPVDTGTSALAVTCADDELHELTRRLLDTAGHVGFGSLEVRRSAADRRMLITEPTVGRPNMQTALTTAAGVNLPEVAYLDAVRRPPRAPLPATGRESIWIHETALPRSLVVTLRRDGPAVRRVLAEALRVRRRPVGAFWAVRDPRPLVAELVRTAGWVARALGRRVPGRRVRGGPLARRRALPR